MRQSGEWSLNGGGGTKFDICRGSQEAGHAIWSIVVESL